MLDEREWLARTIERAKNGDAKAILDMAFVYQRGRLVEKDLRHAEKLFRQAEVTLGTSAWIELLRMLYWQRDPRIHAVFRERADERNGTACYIYGNYLEKIEGNIEASIPIYLDGRNSGHIGCSLRHHRLSSKGIWRIIGLPTLAGIFVRGIIIAMRDENDPRWKT